MVLIFAIPSGLTYTLGRMTGSQRHGWAVWAAMAFLFLVAVTTVYWAEGRGNPLLAGADQQVSIYNRAETWKEKRCASASRIPPCSLP
jgi:K+-transporting ATPase ATPase A chain